MAHVTTHTQHRGNVFVDAIDAIGRFFVLITESNYRVREAERLQRMTDTQLAARGLKREDIARHVFADMYYL